MGGPVNFVGLCDYYFKIINKSIDSTTIVVFPILQVVARVQYTRLLVELVHTQHILRERLGNPRGKKNLSTASRVSPSTKSTQ
jgi:hypothetical protein